MRSNTFDLNERTPECYDQSAQKVLIVVACMIVLYVISIRIYPQTGYFFFPEISVLIAFSSPRWKFVELWNCCAFSNIFTMRSELLKLYQSINNNNDPKLQSILLFNQMLSPEGRNVNLHLQERAMFIFSSPIVNWIQKYAQNESKNFSLEIFKYLSKN